MVPAPRRAAAQPREEAACPSFARPSCCSPASSRRRRWRSRCASRSRSRRAPDQVWQAIGDFCSIAEWHPAIARCAAGEQNGATLRTLTTVDGAVLVERRVQHSEEGMSYSYQIVESPLPVADYEATLAVMDSAGGALITWSGEFAAAGAADAEARAVIEDLYAAGLAALRERLR